MDRVTPEQENKLLGVIREAGAKLMELWPGQFADRSRAQLTISTKPDGSSVTNADLLSNSLIVTELHKLFPTDGIYSEEIKPEAGLSSMRRAWIIDPLDGTSLFIEGKKDFAVLMALCVQARIEFGVMYFPAHNLLLRANRGMGSFANDIPLRVSEARQFRDNSVRVRGIQNPDAHYFLDKADESGPSMLRLSKGEYDGVILRTGKLGEWDIAAPTIIVEEAGGMVSDERGNRILFNQPSINYKFFVASNGFLHEQLLAIIPRDA